MLLLLDGNLEKGVHLLSYLGNLIWVRYLFRSWAVTNQKISNFPSCVRNMLPSNISTMTKNLFFCNLEKGAHVLSDFDYLICLRHFFRSGSVLDRILFQKKPSFAQPQHVTMTRLFVSANNNLFFLACVKKF